MDINLPMSPPVNNSLQGNLYDKLDAISFEKTRVMNCQLDTRRCLQERVINKHRRDAQRTYETQSKRLRQEFRKIHDKKPDYVYDDTDLAVSRSREGHEVNMKQRSNSVPAPKGGHCKRYYQHHYHVKYDQDDKSKKDKQIPREKTDFFNLKLKLFFYNTMENIRKTQQRMKAEQVCDAENAHLFVHEDINLPNIAESKQPIRNKETGSPEDDSVFRSPRESDHVANDSLQNSTDSLWSKQSAVTDNETPKKDGEERCKRYRKRNPRTFRLYGSDTVLNHVNKKRDSCDEKEFAKKKEQWLQTRQSSEKMFSALT